MANQYTTSDGVLLDIPGAYPSVSVQTSNSGLATTGVIMLVGEADSGPDYTLESDLSTNYFGPDQVGSVVAKYKSGPIVDAFRAAAQPANDPQIVGSPSRIYIAKTNPSVKAQASMARAGLTSYATLLDKSYGKLGNQLYFSVSAAQSEVAPTTGSTTYIPSPQSATLAVRVNGGSSQTLAVSAKTSPATLVGSVGTSPSGLNSLSGVMATGGIDRLVMTGITSPATLAFTVQSSNTAIITTSGTWGTTPSVGDTLIIPATGEYGATANSVIWGGADENAGAYIVTAATSNTISVTKLRHDTTNAYTLTTVAAVSVSATPSNELKVFSPVVIKNVTGVNRNILTGLTGKTVTTTVNGSAITFTLQTGYAWAALPQVGDYLFVPSGSAYVGAGSNSGWYTVTAAASSTAAGGSYVTATRLNDGNPVAVASTAIVATTDIQCLRPVIDGVGKVLSVADGGGTDSVSNLFYVTSAAGTKVSWIAAVGNQSPLVSATEYKAKLAVTRQFDNINETWSAGGDIALLIGYNGTTATCTISSTQLTTSVTGGSGANLSLTLADYKTLNDLASYINAQTGYACAVYSSLVGQLSPSVLDEGTFSICSSFSGHTPGRIKKDAYQFANVLSASQAVQLNNPVAAATAGLPEVQSSTYLAGGARGASSQANVTGAIDALALVRGNFLVPLFSRDASLDAADGITDAASSYTIDAINAYAKSHVLAMSTVKRRRNRQAFLSKRDTFLNAKLAANNIASNLCALCFQDVKNIASDGSIKQFQPWMGAVLAAGMQAAGFYKAIFNKGVLCSGIVQAAGDFNDQDETAVSDAIENGLLVLRRAQTGGYRFVSDQTTYGVDSNFVYNSIQANYVAAVIALTTAQRMENAFVGQSIADVSAALALSYLRGIMDTFKGLKLIAPSDDAILGYKNAKIQISGNAMLVDVEVKLASAIYFIPIKFLISQVSQTASQ